MYNTREEVENWLKEMKIKNYVINEDLTVDVNEYVNISDKNLKEIPIKFGKINGDFYCDNNLLTSLKGCPKEVNGSFCCFKNKLTNLEGCPKVVNGYFDCNENNLISLKGCPKVIKGNFYCNDNYLTSLESFPKEINGKFINVKINNIKEEKLVNFHCEMKNINKVYSDFNEDGNVKEFLEKVDFYKNIQIENELLTKISKTSNNIKLNKKL